jgi:hypothetical protein
VQGDHFLLVGLQSEVRGLGPVAPTAHKVAGGVGVGSAISDDVEAARPVPPSLHAVPAPLPHVMTPTPAVLHALQDLVSRYIPGAVVEPI